MTSKELTIFKDLIGCEADDDNEYLYQFLQGCGYYDNAISLINILNYLTDKVKFDINSGFRGSRLFEEDNKFDCCVIEFKSKSDLNKATKALDIYKLHKFDYSTDKKSLIINLVKD